MQRWYKTSYTNIALGGIIKSPAAVKCNKTGTFDELESYRIPGLIART